MLTIRYTPGRVLAVGDIITEDVLNDLANPTIELEGTVSTASIADASITQAKLAPPILTADTPGWALMDDAYVIASKLATSQDWSGFTLTGNPTVVWTGTIDFSGATVTLPTTGGSLVKTFTVDNIALGDGDRTPTGATYAHGLGAVPTVVYWRLKCTSIDAGWAVGDELDISAVSASGDATQSDNAAFAGGANATHVLLSMVDQSGESPPFFTINKDGTFRSTFDRTKWVAKCTAMLVV